MLGVEEIKRFENEDWVAGVMITPHIDSFNLDHPRFHPIWQAAQNAELPICIHAGSGRPPYGIGTEEAAGCHLLRHLMTHPFEQLRAFTTMIGGGVFDLFPKLRAAYIEAGIGWVPLCRDEFKSC